MKPGMGDVSTLKSREVKGLLRSQEVLGPETNVGSGNKVTRTRIEVCGKTHFDEVSQVEGSWMMMWL